MNNKGEAGNIIGVLISIAIVAIVGLILVTGSAQNLETVRNTYNSNNNSANNISGTDNYILISGCQNISGVTIYNSTGNAIIPATNYSINGYVISNGALVTNLSETFATEYTPNDATVVFTCEPYGYGNAGTRGIAGIIIIFGMLAIAVVVLEPTIRSKLLDAIGK